MSKLRLLTINFFLFLFISAQDTCHDFTRMKLNEGDCNCRYTDSVGLNTIAIGWNIEKAGGKEGKKNHQKSKLKFSTGLQNVGANYNLIMSSSCYDGNKCSSSKCINNGCIKESQKEQLYQVSIQESINCVKNWLTNYNELHSLSKSAIIDMAFNMGCTKLSGFKNLKAALEVKDYSKAIVEMKDSNWCTQVKVRCTRDEQCMINALNGTSTNSANNSRVPIFFVFISILLLTIL